MRAASEWQSSGRRSRRERSSSWSQAKAKTNSFFWHVCNKQSHNQLRILLITYTLFSRFDCTSSSRTESRYDKHTFSRSTISSARSASLVRSSLPHDGRFSIELRKGRKSWSESGEATERTRESESRMIGSLHSSRTALLKNEKKSWKNNGSCCS